MTTGVLAERRRSVCAYLTVALLSAVSPLQAQEVVCPGDYPGHLQGVAIDGGDNLYWSFTSTLVKTDAKGTLLGRLAVPKHYGDLTWRDGKVYVAVNHGKFNQEPGAAQSWVYVHDGETLALLEKHAVQEAVHGAGGIEWHDGRFFVVGGLPPTHTANYVYEYTEAFAFVRRHVIESGWTDKGIQTVCRGRDGTWWFGCYGKPAVTLCTDDTFALRGAYMYDCALGVARTEDEGVLWVGRNRVVGKRNIGSVRRVSVADMRRRVRASADPAAAVDEGFEGELPDFHTYQAAYAADATCAHGGSRSLRVTPAKEAGGAYFKLDGALDFASGYEFSAWVKAGADGAARVYVSASDGKARYTVGSVSGGVAGRWVRLHGVIRAKQWRPGDRDFMLALSTRGESWFDDVALRKADVPAPAIEVWPRLEAALHAAADARAKPLRCGESLRLDGTCGALAPAIDRAVAAPVAAPAVAVPAEGLLTFAVDASESLTVTGELELEPDDDLRPGLRATVLSDDTVVGAPMVAAAPWFNAGKPEIGPAPEVQGVRPAATVKLAEWRLEKGRHYLTVAGPHMRAAGLFRGLALHSQALPAESPLYAFALFADTHVGEGRMEWMNVKMDEPAIAELGSTLKQLRAEGAAFALIAGDMTDGGSPSQVEALRSAVCAGGLPVYGCIGNHEVFTAGSRTNLMAQTPGLFPGGKTQFALDRPPLRIVVLDGSWWRDRDGRALESYDKAQAVRVAPKAEELDWLKQTLAADVRTPTLVMDHYPFYSRRGETSCGYRLGPPMIWSPETLAVLVAATNVVGTMNGHMHYNAVDTHAGIVCLQNAAFAEWPHLYRVLRVYPDRLEWEVRQVHNRGFVSEGALPQKALTWMISTREGDLAGRVGLSPRTREQEPR